MGHHRHMLQNYNLVLYNHDTYQYQTIPQTEISFYMFSNAFPIYYLSTNINLPLIMF